MVLVSQGMNMEHPEQFAANRCGTVDRFASRDIYLLVHLLCFLDWPEAAGAGVLRDAGAARGPGAGRGHRAGKWGRGCCFCDCRWSTLLPLMEWCNVIACVWDWGRGSTVLTLQPHTLHLVMLAAGRSTRRGGRSRGRELVGGRDSAKADTS